MSFNDETVNEAAKPIQFAVEAWDPSYGISADETGLEETSNPVDLDVEVPAEEWTPIEPGPDTALPSSLLFVDGVRRIDARVWIPDGRGVSHLGVCATVAAGAVRCRPDGATLAIAKVERALHTATPGAASIDTKHARYDLRPLMLGPDSDLTQAMNLAVHSHMTAIETTLDVPAEFGEMVIFDGPLRGRESAAAVGYIKTQHVQYLPDAQQLTVMRLGAGQRTPVFGIGGQFARWSWYLRLPGPAAHGLSGIVRVELSALGRAEEATYRADQVTAALPRFASTPHKDTRAPQNLHPIAGLERELRRRLGDPQLLERALRLAARAAELQS